MDKFGLDTPLEQYASYTGMVVTLSGIPALLAKTLKNAGVGIDPNKPKTFIKGTLWAATSSMYVAWMGTMFYKKMNQKMLELEKSNGNR